MPFFDSFAKKVEGAAKTAAKKSGDLVETTKINMSINSELDKIKAIHSELGKIVYSKFQSGEDLGLELTEKCRQIKDIEDNIETLRDKTAQLKNPSHEEEGQTK